MYHISDLKIIDIPVGICKVVKLVIKLYFKYKINNFEEQTVNCILNITEIGIIN